MLNNIKINLELLESMLFFWKATSEKEKVGEAFIYSISDHENMKYLYDEEFDGESVRRAISAISNREIFSPKSKKEGRFWNNSMWMLEDPGLTEEMVKPLKVLNLDELKNKVQSEKFDEVEIVIIPGHLDTIYTDVLKKKIIINFFKIRIDLNDGKCYIEEKELMEYLVEIL